MSDQASNNKDAATDAKTVRPMPPAPMRPATAGSSDEKRPQKGSPVLVVGIIVCVLAVIALVAALLFTFMKPADQGSQVPTPTKAQAEEVYKRSNIPMPTLSGYANVVTTNLGTPEIADVTVGTVSYSSNDGQQVSTCDTTAKAVFDNEHIKVTEPITMRMTYNPSTKTWEGGSVQGSASPTVEPTGIPDVAAIQKSVPELLQKHDPEIAKQFIDCDIATSKQQLDAKGGDVTFTLAKADASANKAKKCDVTIRATWEDGKGYKLSIDSVGAVSEGTIDGSAPNGSPTDVGDEAPSMLLVCRTGELVEVPGTIQYQNDRVLLRADNVIRVELDGKTYTTRYFELVSNSLVVTVGQHLAAIGEISATGVLTQAPLVINLDYS